MIGPDDAQLPPAARELVDEVVRLLVHRDYLSLERLCGGARLSASELMNAVAAYGRTLTLPLRDHSGVFDIVPLGNNSGWSAIVHLWTEERRSDLSLDLSLIKDGENFRLEIDDLHVR